MQTRWLPAATVALGLVLPASARAQTWDHEPVEAMMIARGERGEELSSSPLPLVEERLKVEIDGQHATTTLLQVYQNNAPGQVEGRYTLRAGTGSHVEGFAYWNGEA